VQILKRDVSPLIEKGVNAGQKTLINSKYFYDIGKSWSRHMIDLREGREYAGPVEQKKS
jgi:hypothetical protein